MSTPTWKATLAAAIISSSVVFGLGHLFIWMVSR